LKSPFGELHGTELASLWENKKPTFGSTLSTRPYMLMLPVLRYALTKKLAELEV
jgi:hypothetical protein